MNTHAFVSDAPRYPLDALDIEDTDRVWHEEPEQPVSILLDFIDATWGTSNHGAPK